MKKLTLFILLLLTSSVIWSQDNLPYTDKDGFSISYPDGWTKEASTNDYNIRFVSQRRSGQLFVKVLSFKQAIDPNLFLSTIEKKLGKNNIITPDKRPLESAVCKAVGADQGAMGVFMLGDKETPVRQIYYIFSKDLKLFNVVFTYAEMEKETYRPILKNFLNSFKISK